MPARIIDGKALADAWRVRLGTRVRDLRARGIQPCLAAVTVAADPAWGVYLRGQAKACEAVGIIHRIVELPTDATQEDLSERIESLNVDPAVHGIIIQSPLKPPFSELQAQALLSPDKDVEAVGPANLGLVLAGRHVNAPCTAVAAVILAREALPDLRGIEAVVVGASAVVGRPIAQLLLAAGATVTTCHIDTKDLRRHTLGADLLVVAVGKAGLIGPGHVKPGAVVVDVGINCRAGKDGKPETVGDCAPEVATVASALTPVPGGVGALTTTVLLEATVNAAVALAESRPSMEGETLARVLGGAALPPDLADRVAELLSRHLIHTPGTKPLKSAFERRLARGALVLDGAMGSELIARGVAPGAVTQASLDHPDLVKAVHRAYLDAGADLLTANTFAANRWRCRGDRELAVRLATAGVRLVREVARAASSPPFVFASVGPLGVTIGAEVSRAEAEDAFAEVALAMADAGADGFAVETMSSTEEAAAALAAIRRVSRLPVLVSRTLDRDDPAELGEFARACETGGAAAVGINCAAGPRAVAPVVARLASLTTLPVLARPNAGFPTRVDGRPVYHLRPEYLVEQARAYLAAGVGLIGGCCGVGPAHVAALAKAISGQPVPPRTVAASVPVPFEVATRAVHPLLARVASGGFPVLAFVPGRLPPVAANAALARLAAAGADAVGLLTGWPGSARGPRLPARLRHLQDGSGRPAVLELIAGDLTLPAAQEQLLTAHLLGMRLVLIDGGVFAGETRADLQGAGCDPSDLLALVRRLNAGRDLAGTRLEEATAFTVGVRVPTAAVDRIDGWVEQGADFLTLQPVYEPARFRSLMERAHVRVPVLAEILLLPDAATADELDNELPALSVPEALKRRLTVDPEEDARGVLRFLHHWRERLAGVCLLLPDARVDAAERVIAALPR